MASNLLKTVLVAGAVVIPFIAMMTAHAQDVPNPTPILNTQEMSLDIDGQPAVVDEPPVTEEEAAPAVVADPALQIQRNRSIPIEVKAQQQSPNPGLNDLLPLIFLKDEYDLLQEAKAILYTRPPLPGEIDRVGSGEEIIDPGIRELSLAGIVYRSGRDWTIWFNEQRVTPKAIPEEVLDLRVHKDYIEIKWFDAYTNQIFPIRLRPHQRFNLDSRIFLPG